MRTYPFEDDYMPDDDCSCGQCDQHDDIYFDEEDVYDDPHDVVMYDIDEAAANSLYSLILMLEDSAREWYARRKLNSLAASVELQHALVATIIIDSLGRRWNPLLHPRDRHGKFINTGGFFRWLMRGDWQRGQVVRIDSDGTIHALSDGNPNIPDGTPLKFNNKDSAKFIATRGDKASISEGLVDLDADIPGFPEASPNQKRIFNALQFGDMPAEDIYKYRVGDNNTTTDFADEIAELRTRQLVDITPGDPARISRTDNDQLGIIDIDEVDAVPSDETPDVEDGPNLTQEQRDLLDQITSLDRGDGDGVGLDELGEVNQDDLDALVEEGVLERIGDSGQEAFHLPNPEAGDSSSEDAGVIDETPEPEGTEERDPVAEGRAAAEKRFPGNKEQQDVFNERVDELVQGIEVDDADFDRSEMRARNAADAWWEEFNAPEADQGVDTGSDNESDAPSTNRIKYDEKRNLRRGRDFLGQSMSDEMLDENEEQARAIGDLIHAQDLRDSGDELRADFYKRKGLDKLGKLGIDNDEEAWEDQISSFREDERTLAAEEPDAPEVADLPEVDAPESDVPEQDVVPESDVPEDVESADIDEDVPTPDVVSDEDILDDIPEADVEEESEVVETPEISEDTTDGGDIPTPPDADVLDVGGEDEGDESNSEDVISLEESNTDAPDATKASENPIFQRMVNQEPFNIEDYPALTDDSGGLLDAEGRPVELGGWYKARRGGGRDPLEVVGFVDQRAYPGWFVGRRPDGKLKAVHAVGEGDGSGGMRRIGDVDFDDEVANWRAQDRIRVFNGNQINVEELDQYREGNRMANGEPAAVGMVVEAARPRSNGALRAGELGIVNRFGMITDNKGVDHVVAYVILPGAADRGLEKMIYVDALRPGDANRIPEMRPEEPSLDLPEGDVDVPESDFEFPAREWQIPLDDDIIERAAAMGEVPLIDFANAHIRPREVYDQIRNLVDQGRLEFVPEPEDGAPRFRIPAVEEVPDILSDLPDGANNSAEGEILELIDNLGENGQARRGELIDIDADDASNKLNALNELVSRGVLERVEDEEGRPAFRRSTAPPLQSSRQHDPSRGTDAGSEYMNRAQAVKALQDGADPMTVRTDDLLSAMRLSGRFEIEEFDANNIGTTFWAYDRMNDGPFEVPGDSAARRRMRRYFIKEPAENNPEGNWRAELMAAAISQSAGAFDPNTGGLYHPQTTSLDREHIMADFAAYGFPEGTELTTLNVRGGGILGWDLDVLDTPRSPEFTEQDMKDLAPERIKLLLFDWLANNSLDRHGGNQMYAKLPDGTKRVVIIDNGYGDGENWGHNDPTMNDIKSFLDAGSAGNGWGDKFQRAIRKQNNDLTKDDLRGIVREFYDQYKGLNVDAIIDQMMREHNLSPSDEVRLRTWLNASRARLDQIGNNFDEVVDELAKRFDFR